MRLSHIARGAASAERGRRLMELRGVTPNGHPLWNALETGDIIGDYPHYGTFAAKHERRTRPAAHSKAVRLRITRPRGKPWDDPNEIWRLRLYETATKAELLTAFPGRTWGAICAAARKRGFRRRRLPLASTGITVIDQILSRSGKLGWTLADLDSAGRKKLYFTRRKWRGRLMDHAVHLRVVEALGGQVRARTCREPIS